MSENVFDFSNIGEHFSLTYEKDPDYLSHIYFRAHNEGVVADNYSNTAWTYEVPTEYQGNVSTTDFSTNHGSVYPCFGIVQLDENAYMLMVPQEQNLSFEYAYVGRFRYTDNVTLTPSFYGASILAIAPYFLKYCVIEGLYLPYYIYDNYQGGTVSGKWDVFYSRLMSTRTAYTYSLGPMLHEVFNCYTGIPSGYTPTETSYAHVDETNFGKITIETNIPVFLLNNEENFIACYEFYRTGDSSWLDYAWDGKTEILNPQNLYYHIKYRTETRDQYGQNPTYSDWTDKWIVWEETEKNAIAGYQDESEPLSFNLVGYSGVACKTSEDGGETWTEHASAPAEYQSTIWWAGQLADGSGYVRYSERSRNINVFRTEASANQYIATGDNEEEAIDPEVTNPAVDRDPDFGTKEYTTSFPVTPYITNNTRHAYYMTSTDVAALKAAIFADTATMETIVEGTQFWASSHLDCITDCCFYPVDLVALSTTAVSRSSFVMGGWVHNCFAPY